MKKKVIAIISSIVIFLGGFGSSWLIFGQKKEVSNEVANVSNTAENTTEQKNEAADTSSQQTANVTEPKLLRFDNNSMEAPDAVSALGLESGKLSKYLTDLLSERFYDANGIQCSFVVNLVAAYGDYAYIVKAGQAVPASDYATVSNDTCGMQRDRYIVGPNAEGKIEKLSSAGTQAIVGCSNFTSINLPEELEKYMLETVPCLEEY